MNQSLFLHIVEKLEALLGKLPATIQKPILHELTPLKELFLQQRPPRFVFIGSSNSPLPEILAAFFGLGPAPADRDSLTEIFRWQEVKANGHGTLVILDARGADDSAVAKIDDELRRQSADIFFFLADDHLLAARHRKHEIENLAAFLNSNEKLSPNAKVIGIYLPARRRAEDAKSAHAADNRSKLQFALEEKSDVRERLLDVIQLPFVSEETGAASISTQSQHLMSLLARQLPNPARVEMIRIARDRAAQAEVAQLLVKSTAAICAAIGTQPIPLADMPILTTLQLVMVSGIMYLSGRERSLRAATEFIGVLGANVGAGMVLREGARAILKFFPGWGNVVCGMVAGAGTYAIGRAAIVYFVEGVSLKEARRTYVLSRKKLRSPKLAPKATTASIRSS